MAKVIKRWSPEECQKLTELYQQKLSPKDIAAQMDRSYPNVIWKIRDLKLRDKGKEQRRSGTGGTIIYVSAGHLIHRSK